MSTWIDCLWGPFMQQNLYFSSNTKNLFALSSLSDLYYLHYLAHLVCTICTIPFGCPWAPFGYPLGPFGLPLGSLWLSLADFAEPLGHIGNFIENWTSFKLPQINIPVPKPGWPGLQDHGDFRFPWKVHILLLKWTPQAIYPSRPNM